VFELTATADLTQNEIDAAKKLGADLDRDATSASDAARVRALSSVVKGLENAKS